MYGPSVVRSVRRVVERDGLSREVADSDGFIVNHVLTFSPFFQKIAGVPCKAS